MPANSIYFVSTVLHLYIASTLALKRTNEDAHLIIIDQPENSGFPVMKAYLNWQSSPFTTHRQYFGRYKKIRAKLKSRKNTFEKLDSMIEELKPRNIFVGNDRRIEFQYSMSQCEKKGIDCIGHYMDEGIFTYTGREASSSISDKYIDSYIKKLTYGFWWKNPITIGGSEWIKEVHVAFPELIHPLLLNKKIHCLDSQQFQTVPIKELSAEILKQYQVNKQSLSNLDVLITLPHESIFQKQSNYSERIITLVQQLQQRGLSVSAKYHPRNSTPDKLNLSKAGVNIQPAQAVIEALLTLLPPGSSIVGDMSSTMLITRWLRNDINVYYLNTSNTSLTHILHSTGVRSISDM